MSRWVLFVPFLIFGLGATLFFSTESEVKVRFEKAQEWLRKSHTDRAIAEFQEVVQNYPESSYSARALWELGTIYYTGLYQVAEAADYFKQLEDQYPDDPLAAEAVLKLAEIHSREFQDLHQAIRIWRDYQDRWPGSPKRRQIQFDIGNAFYQLGQLDEAREQLEVLIGPDDEVAAKACLTVATIFQLKEQYTESLEYFEEAAAQKRCGSCRLLAQLGWIESLEFLGHLAEAIDVASSIDSGDYPAAKKQELLARLMDKQKYIEPN